ncbi:hypothetical protein D9M72_640720 [compost metagenome]
MRVEGVQPIERGGVGIDTAVGAEGSEWRKPALLVADTKIGLVVTAITGVGIQVERDRVSVAMESNALKAQAITITAMLTSHAQLSLATDGQPRQELLP